MSVAVAGVIVLTFADGNTALRSPTKCGQIQTQNSSKAQTFVQQTGLRGRFVEH